MHDVLKITANNVKGLCEHFSTLQTQFEQVTKAQQDFLREMSICQNKHAYGVDTRGGAATQDRYILKVDTSPTYL